VIDNQIIIVAGPTATGKTSFALKLAEKLNANIVNADSRQIYKGLKIGTNKEPLQKRDEVIEFFNIKIQSYYVDNTKVVGWLYNLKNINEEFCVFDYRRYAEEVIKYLLKDNKKVIVVGGTGLYIDSLIKPLVYQVYKSKELRNKLVEKSINELQNLALKNFPSEFKKLNNSDKNNSIRVIRLIEKSTYKNKTQEIVWEPYTYKMFYPIYNRTQLKKRLLKRVQIMLNQGLIEETKNFYDKGFSQTKALQGIGYKQVIDFLENKLSSHELVEKIANAHYRYAMKQETWFKSPNRKYKLELTYFEN